MKRYALLLGIGLAAASTALAGGRWNIGKLNVTKLPPASDKTGLTFDKDIKPILDNSCTRCHGEDRSKGDLRLDSLDAALKGGMDGKVVVPGSSDKSLLVLAVSQQDEATAMPPKFKPRHGGPGGPGGPGGGTPPPPPAGGGGSEGPGGPPPGGMGGPGGGPPGGFQPPKPLTAEQVGLIRAWIDQGAK
jgi:hypothetical protein